MSWQGKEATSTLSEAAKLWRVSRTTPHRWWQAGWLPCFYDGPRGLTASLADVRAAKVLSESALSQHGVAADVLREALQTAVVCPHEGRFSLDDVDELLRLAALGHGAPSTVGERRESPMRYAGPPPPPRRLSGVQFAVFRWSQQEVEAWVEEGADPTALPDSFWAMPVMPRFIGPADVFLYEFGKRRRGGIQLVRRSGGYAREAGKLVWHSEKEDCTRDGVRLRVGESMPRAWAESSHRYRMASDQWVREWYRRRPISTGS
jgi:hypothetical protein